MKIILGITIIILVTLTITSLIRSIYVFDAVSSANTEIELQKACKVFNNMTLNNIPAKCLKYYK